MPKMLFKHFVNSQGQLYYLAQASRTGRPRLRTPSQVFYELDSNAYIGVDGQRRIEVEQRLSAIEGQADVLLCRILRSVILNRVPVLSRDDRYKLAEFNLTLFKRSPKVRSRHATEEFAREQLVESLSFLLDQGVQLTPDVFQLIKKSDWVNNATKQGAVKATLIHSNQLLSEVAKRQILFGVPKNPKKSFVLGSTPFVRLRGEQTNGFGDPASEFWLPISPRVALAWVGVRPESEIFLMDDKMTRLLNLQSWASSSGAAAANPQLLISLADAR